MPPSKDAYVTACQQVLALGVVFAVLAPAATVISLDVVTQPPGPAAGASASRGAHAALAGARTRARVPTAPVDAHVAEIPLTAAGAGAAAPDGRLALRRTKAGRTEVVSRPEAVDGFGTVGVTWARAGESLDVAVRTRQPGSATWSAWQPMAADGDDGPDPGSAEAARSRPGTDPVVVGDVADVQVRARSAQGTPADLRLAVITPGVPVASRIEAPALDTGADDTPADTAADTAADTTSDTTDGLALRAGTVTAKPTIYSRAQWGADERLRDASSLHYGEVHAGVVHHTVNANTYTPAEVPGILRSIYAYHTRSRGWSDIGYNYLIDRFGRIWEGRYGGIDRDPVGAHTRGYNDDAFAASAIGNYETAQPSAAVITAYAKLFAWKLSLAGVSAASTRQYVTSRWFPAILGHRDAGQTACPGRYLYAQIPRIRALAASYQADWSGRQRTTDLNDDGYGDVVLRRRGTGAAYLLRTRGLLRLGTPITVASTGWSKKDLVVATPDVTGDGRGDVIARSGVTGRTRVYAGDGAGGLTPGPLIDTLGPGVGSVTGVGDLDGDGHNDLVGVVGAGKPAYVWSGDGAGGFTQRLLARTWPYAVTAGVGDFDGDGHNDLVGRDAVGRLWLVHGAGRHDAVGSRTLLAPDWSSVQALAGFGDWTGDRRPDIVARTPNGTYVFPNVGGIRLGHWLGSIGTTTGPLSSAQLAGTGAPDLLVRSGDTLRVLPHNGTFSTQPLVRLSLDLTGVTKLLNVGDWDRDGHGDLVVKRRGGDLQLLRGNGAGGFAAPQVIGNVRKVKLLAAVGDYTGDGYPDLVGQVGGTQMRILPGRGAAGLGPSYLAHSAIPGTKNVGVGRWDADGAPDTMTVTAGRVVLYPGNGPGGLTTPRAVAGSLVGYDWVLGSGDVTGDGHADLVVREKATGYLWALPGTTTGFGTRIFLGEGYGAFDRAG